MTMGHQDKVDPSECVYVAIFPWRLRICREIGIDQNDFPTLGYDPRSGMPEPLDFGRRGQVDAQEQIQYCPSSQSLRAVQLGPVEDLGHLLG